MALNETKDAMFKLAEGTVKINTDIDLDFSEASIERVEQHLAEVFDFIQTPECRWTETRKWSYALGYGGYVGEVLRRHYGGEWQAGTISNPTFVVGGVVCKPAEKVMKRLANGVEDHLGHYYLTILTLIEASKGRSGQVVVD